MELDTYLTAIADCTTEITHVVEEDSLPLPVPTCPEWTINQLLAHLGHVQSWAASVLRAAIVGEAVPPRPKEPAMLEEAPSGIARLDWLQGCTNGLMEALTTIEDETECWTFFPATSGRHFWARRQAHEAHLHLVDSELAVGRPIHPIPPSVAADGIAEALTGYFARPGSNRSGREFPYRIAFEATDADSSWTIRVTDTSLEAVPRLEHADLVINAPASAIFLLIWNRVDSSQLHSVGYAELLDQWRASFQGLYGR
ncbi:MAG: maleylpyruvate isomerase family mycothiol-dependent enzyme [Acidimicrobiales bacterium]